VADSEAATPTTEGEAIGIALARSAGVQREKIAAAANIANRALRIGKLLEVFKSE
jgi:hypothetical protein